MKYSLIAVLILFSSVASAHVKWFVNYDTTRAPVPFYETFITVPMLLLLALSLGVIYVTSCLDRLWPAPADLPKWRPLVEKIRNFVPALMRWGTSVFFALLFFFFPDIILTPDLVIDNPGLIWVHLLIALSAPHYKTSFIAGLGILFLYGYAIQLYGLFHMIDYLIFVGTAVYLIVQSVKNTGLITFALEIVRLTSCFAFMWGAIEKFMQPILYEQLLTNHDYLLMGIDMDLYIKAAGFVEFCLTWHILTGKLASFASLVILFILVTLAFIPFGMTDFIGHFLLIVPLIAILSSPREQPVFERSATSTLAFMFTFCFFLMLSYTSYYLLHYQLHLHLW
ncbi:hypothetical protein AAF463_24775 (plasmid) [Pantoea sp. BJ2]|uniref:Uncharacterized protein n=1 Tax=Pantoea sp. BJ2 TaxID=3141322 RepID=A0AAU7U3G7_9GAMM